jgi:hypothetical protein
LEQYHIKGDYTTIWCRTNEKKSDLDISGMQYAELGLEAEGYQRFWVYDHINQGGKNGGQGGGLGPEKEKAGQE